MRARDLPLPKSWPTTVCSAVLHVISLAQFAAAYTRGWAADSRNARMRLQAENDRLKQEINLLKEEIRIKDERMGEIAPRQRPNYPPTERMAILQMRAAQGWSMARVAEAFLVAPRTIAQWLKRLDEQGPHALVQLHEPVNRFPDFVRYLVRQLKILCPSLGKVKIAHILARAGLHLAPSTVGRMLSEPQFPKRGSHQEQAGRVVTAWYPNHVWHVDLTTVAVTGGFWVPWLPFALPQRWPFCHWVAIAVDHYSRRVIGFMVFKKQPTSTQVRAFLGRAIGQAKATPKHLICDKGTQFWAAGFKAWCRKKNIKPRYGAVGRHGSIAVVERFIRTLKQEGLRGLLIPFNRGEFRRQVKLFIDWYNQHRPHSSLSGCTPNERYFRRKPANRQPRWEPRAKWPRPSPCAKPRTLAKGQPGTTLTLTLEIEFVDDENRLPVATLKRAA